MTSFFISSVSFLFFLGIPAAMGKLSHLPPAPDPVPVSLAAPSPVSVASPLPPSFSGASPSPLPASPRPASPRPASPPRSPWNDPGAFLLCVGLGCGAGWGWVTYIPPANKKIPSLLKTGTLVGVIFGLALWAEPQLPSRLFQQVKSLFRYTVNQIIQEFLQQLSFEIKGELKNCLKEKRSSL